MSFLAAPPFWRLFRKASLLQQATWLIQALTMGLLWQLSALLPPDRASSISRRAMQLIGPLLPRTAKIERNLRHAFADKDDREIKRLLPLVWGNIGAVIAEYPHLQAIAETQRLETLLRAKLELFETPGRPAIFVASHLANWEIAPLALSGLMQRPVSIVYSRQRNPLFDGMLRRKREALQCGFVAKEAGARPLIQLLESGTSLGFLADVRINSGQPIPFFGEDAMTTITPARLALRYHCQLVPIQIERLQGTHFRVTAHPPVEADDPAADTTTQAIQMMSKVNALYQSWIEQHPEQWWCPKNRWPKNREKIQKLIEQRRRSLKERDLESRNRKNRS